MKKVFDRVQWDEFKHNVKSEYLHNPIMKIRSLLIDSKQGQKISWRSILFETDKHNKRVKLA